MNISIVKGPDAGTFIDLTGAREVLIGRGEDCEIRISDSGSSRHHARLVAVDGHVTLEDLGSTNGTLVNGLLAIRRELSPGDIIAVGSTELRVDFRAAASRLYQSSQVNLSDAHSQVLKTMHHREADVLSEDSDTVFPAAAAEENRILRQACEISQMFSSAVEPAQLLPIVLDRIVTILPADTACVLTRGDDSAEWEVAEAAGAALDESFQVSRALVRETIENGNAVLSRDAAQDERFAASHTMALQNIRSVISAPLKTDERLHGVLIVDRRSARQSFREADLRFMATVGNMLGVFMEKVRYEREAREKQRLAVVGEVMAGLAHYAKNIITGLRFSTATLDRVLQQQDIPAAQRQLRSISEQERRISNLILDMLSYSKDRKPEPAPVALPAIVESVVAPHREQLSGRGVALDVESPPDLPEVLAEEQAIHRVFLNLFLNAVDAVAGREKAHIRVALAETPADRGVELRIRDTGCGIPSEKLPKIFDVFYSTKGSRGTGLGLAVVHKIIQEHGGRIEVDSLEGEWTEFRVVLPGARDKSSVKAPGAPTARTAP